MKVAPKRRSRKRSPTRAKPPQQQPRHWSIVMIPQPPKKPWAQPEGSLKNSAPSRKRCQSSNKASRRSSSHSLSSSLPGLRQEWKRRWKAPPAHQHRQPPPLHHRRPRPPKRLRARWVSAAACERLAQPNADGTISTWIAQSESPFQIQTEAQLRGGWLPRTTNAGGGNGSPISLHAACARRSEAPFASCRSRWFILPIPFRLMKQTRTYHRLLAGIVFVSIGLVLAVSGCGSSSET